MEIIFKGRQTDVPARFRKYATAKLNKLEKLDQKAISVDVELSVERNPRQASQKERVELTIWSRGPAIRAEAAAEDRIAALDLALAKLDSRLRRALDRRKHHHGAGIGAVTGASGGIAGGAGPGDRPGGLTGASVPAARSESAAQGRADPAEAQPDDEAVADSVVPIKMEGDGPLVVRQKFHHAKPISIDQALLEMELVGHDFYLFYDIEEDAPSVVYRRHGYQYGVIRLIQNSAAPGELPESSEGLGARIPARRRADAGRARAGQSRAGAVAEAAEIGQNAPA
jgi:ribosomal subunit interface protein